MRAIVRLNNVQGKADKLSAFVQLKDAEGRVSKISAPSLAEILRKAEWTQDSFAKTGVLYAPMTVYGIVGMTEEENAVRTAVFMADNECKISTIRNGELATIDMCILMNALGDEMFAEVHTILQDDDLQYADFWGWNIPESHIEAIIRADNQHKNGKQATA